MSSMINHMLCNNLAQKELSLPWGKPNVMGRVHDYFYFEGFFNIITVCVQ